MILNFDQGYKSENIYFQTTIYKYIHKESTQVKIDIHYNTVNIKIYKWLYLRLGSI